MSQEGVHWRYNTPFYAVTRDDVVNPRSGQLELIQITKPTNMYRSRAAVTGTNDVTIRLHEQGSSLLSW